MILCRKIIFLDYVLDKFRILGRSVDVGFIAQSNELIDKKDVVLKRVSPKPNKKYEVVLTKKE